MKHWIFCLIYTAYLYGDVPEPHFFNYQTALTRDLSSSFEESLKLSPPPIPIDLEIAHRQHHQYIQILESLVPHVMRLEEDPSHPDCNFIEDTALVIGDVAVISRMGALERRGEEKPVAQVLEKLGLKTVFLQSPATMDGGDLLYTGRHLFVGLSRRTNEGALQQLQEIFGGQLDVIGVPVSEGLHLKSLISFFDAKILVIAKTGAGALVQEKIQQSVGQVYTFIEVPDVVASNVLRVGSALLVQEGFPESEHILQELCDRENVQMISLNMSELIKADGALTCGSLLF